MENEEQPTQLNVSGVNNCPSAKDKPINIVFEQINGFSGSTLSDAPYFHAKISVMIRIDRSTVGKYVEKKLTLEDFNDIIKSRL